MTRRQGRLTVWEAVQFVWHYRYRHPNHAEGTYYDDYFDVVRCGGCWRTWPPR